MDDVTSCMKPAQLGRGFSISVQNQPVCQTRSRFTEGGKVYGENKVILGFKRSMEKAVRSGLL